MEETSVFLGNNFFCSRSLNTHLSKTLLLCLLSQLITGINSPGAQMSTLIHKTGAGGKLEAAQFCVCTHTPFSRLSSDRLWQGQNCCESCRVLRVTISSNIRKRYLVLIPKQTLNNLQWQIPLNSAANRYCENFSERFLSLLESISAISHTYAGSPGF